MAEKTFDARRDQLDDVLAFVTEQLEELECPARKVIQIQVAVEELFVNIASYAYAPGSGTADIAVELVPEPRAVEITLKDRGVPYDPLAKPDPDVTLTAEQRKIGGLGIYMVKKSMDSMRYKYENGQNILTITRLLG